MLSKNAPVKVRRLKRQSEALTHRIAGKRYDEIAKLMGCSKATASRLVVAALDGLRIDIGEKAETYRDLLTARLETLTASLLPAAQKGEVKAAAALVNVINRQARLWGLDAPTVVKASVTNGGLPDVSKMSDAELEEAARHLGISVPPTSTANTK